MAHKISIPFVSPQVEALLLWRDIRKSAAVLGGATALYAFVALSTLNPLALVLRILALGAFIALAYQTGSSTFGRPGLQVPSFSITYDSLKPALDKALPHINKFLTFLGVLISGKNAPISLEFAAISFILSYIVAVLPPLTLAYLVVLLAFTLPKVYEVKKDEIDKLLAKANEEIKKLYAKLDDAVLKKLPGRAPAAAKAPTKAE